MMIILVPSYGGTVDYEPGCDDLDKYWYWNTKCVCQQKNFWMSNLNETYQKYFEEDFDAYFDSVRSDNNFFYQQGLFGCYDRVFECGAISNKLSALVIAFIAAMYIFK